MSAIEIPRRPNGFDKLNDLLSKRGIKPCSKKGCLAIQGSWLPTLKFRLQGQMNNREFVAIPIPILLCEVHRDECRAADILTEEALRNVDNLMVKMKGRHINRDTMELTWEFKGVKLPGPKLV